MVSRMEIDLSRSELTVYRNGPLRLSKARGRVIRCVEGRVWITQAGQWEDVFLGPGGTLCVASDGLLLIEGAHEGKVRVLPPECRGLGSRSPGSAFQRWLVSARTATQTPSRTCSR